MKKIIRKKRRKHKVLRYLEYKILHIQDSPHKISLGVGLGLFIAWTPFLGLHILMALVLSVLLRANKFAALVSIWVSNVFTFAVIYYPAYLVGRFVLQLFPWHENMSKERVSELFNDLFRPGNMITGFFTKDYWSRFWTLTSSIGTELWLGCFLVGGLVAVAGYIFCYYLINHHRTKNPHRRYKILC
jgi:uncharacterized protein (DUF2062 family)